MEVENSDLGGSRKAVDEDVIMEIENSDRRKTFDEEDIVELENGSSSNNSKNFDDEEGDIVELENGSRNSSKNFDDEDEDIVELENGNGNSKNFDEEEDVVELENSDRESSKNFDEEDIVELENSDSEPGSRKNFDEDVMEVENSDPGGRKNFDEDIMEVENSDPLAGAGSDNENDESSRDDMDDDLEELVVVNGKSTSSDDANNANHTTIVVNDAKSLVELANSKNDPGKEPTLVIIDTNSILSGKGPVPMNKRTSSGPGSNETMSRSPNSSIDIPDDAFLIEAPSFIVPYVFEQSGETSMKTYINNLAQKVRDVKEAKLAKGEELTPEDEIPEPKKLNSEDYFDSPVGRLLRNIGMNLVQEFVQVDLLKMQKRQGEKEKAKNRSAVMTHITQQSIISLKRNIEESKENNEPFKSKMKKCELCNFRTESELVMSTHLETPHMKNYSYRCNFCTYTTRVPHEIMFHMEAEHNVKSRLERAPAYHQCPSCPFEDNSKAKLNRHILGCIKRFDINKNLIPPMDWDTPAKLPKLPKNRMLPQGMNINPAFLAGVNQQRSIGSYAALASKYMAGNKGNLPPLAQAPKNKPIPGLIRANNPRVMQNPMMNPHLQRGMMMRGRSSGMGQVQPAHLQLTNNQMLQQVVSGQLLGATQGVASGFLNKLGLQPGPNASMQKSASHQSMRGGVKSNNQPPSISITPLPRQAANPSGSSAAQQKAGGKTSFVICEICDGYIKDLDQLRNHMQWIHKVKIHPKMIYNKPPLNCQKCQFRFFTDQGLERHLLGSHGLVTSSMQDAANKGQDSGRCPLCGKVYQWKLLAHVAKDHNVTLKPAHLSYKCTVCTATFGMYKLFESHVYSAHSVTKNAPRNDRRPQGGSQQQIPNKMNQLQVTPRAMPSSTSQGNSFKPFKINDEITIIPQPMANNSLAHRNKGSLTITPQSAQHARRNLRPEDEGIQIIEIDDV